MNNHRRVMSVSTRINVRSYLMMCGCVSNQRSSTHCPRVGTYPMFRPGMGRPSGNAYSFRVIRNLRTSQSIARCVYAYLNNVTNVVVTFKLTILRHVTTSNVPIIFVLFIRRIMSNRSRYGQLRISRLRYVYRVRITRGVDVRYLLYLLNVTRVLLTSML